MRRENRRFSGPNAEVRVYFVAAVVVAGMVTLVGKLWWEQIARGEHWTRKIAARSEVTVRIPAVRGEIRDRNGVTLVGNRASYELDFYLPDMVRGYRQQYGTPPMMKYTQPVRQMLTVKREEDIVSIVNSTILPRLTDLNLARPYYEERLRRHFRNNTEVPFAYLEELDFGAVARFAEHNVGLPGVDVALRPVRQYVFGALGVHFLGYVGPALNLDKLPDIRDYTFYQPDVEGKNQLEYKMNRWMKGIPGVRVLQRNVKGVIEGEVRRVAPQQGHNVYLTVDVRLQYVMEKAFRDAEIGRGASVLVDPNSGEILAMTSVPSYDPNTFIPSISQAEWDALNKDETHPLMNRAILGYAPGSTYKTVSALAGFHKGLGVKSTFSCAGGVSYGGKYMKCWVTDKHLSPHGMLSLPDALKVSCNAFFYQWGNAAGIENIVAVGDALGLGRPSGLPLTSEDAGILPGPDWLRSVNPRERWSNGYTANVSIGQGSVEASPLQMAMVTATIANGGTSYFPKLVGAVRDQSGKDVVNPDTGALVAPRDPVVRARLPDMGVEGSDVQLVRSGMWKVVNEGGGTGRRAMVKGQVVAGKTGTAQFWREVKGKKEKDNHTWFIAFAPFDAPRYAVCVMVQGAKSGGDVAAPVAQRILEQAFQVEQGWDPGVTRMSPAVGSFAQLGSVNYKEGTKFSAPVRSDGEEAQGGAATPVKKPSQAPAPSIKSEADSGPVPRAVPASAKEPEKRSFFERLFGPKTKSPTNPPSTTPSPQRANP
jgi:penicillin-binding protein 2